MVAVYPKLRRLASRYFSGESPSHTLQPTALVHEAYCRLVEIDDVTWQGRTHFFAVGARVMRRLLVDHARGRNRDKRGGGLLKVTLHEGANGLFAGDLDLEQILTLEAALGKLSELDPRQAQIVELRFFAGLTVQEVATALDLSKRTVEGDWAHARAWLRCQFEDRAE